MTHIYQTSRLPGARSSASGAKLSRRTFVRHAGMAMTLVLAGGRPGHVLAHGRHGPVSEPKDGSRPRRPPQLGAFDLHSHPGDFHRRSSPTYAGDQAFSRHMEAARDAGLTGAFVALVADAAILRVDRQRGPHIARKFEPGEAWADYRRQIRDLHELLEGSPARLQTEVPEAGVEAEADRGLAAFVACEGGDMLEGKPERVQEIYRDGVRCLQLVHYTQNELGDLQTASGSLAPGRSHHGGLSPIGREVVREMGRLGMIVDVAHASLDTVRDVVEATEGPVVLSHSLLKHDGVHPGLLPRLLTPEHARLVSQTGGVIGIWPLGVFDPDEQASMQDFVDATLRLIDAVGVNHVGYSTDMGTMSIPFREYDQLARWKEGLLDGGLSLEEMRNVAGGNAWRVLKEVLGDAAR